MMTRAFGFAVLSMFGAIGPCSKSSDAADGGAASVATTTTTVAAKAGSANTERWVTNGATACEKFLTPDVVSAILAHPTGTAQKDDPRSCHLGPIYITLEVHSLERFRLEIPQIALTHPLSGPRVALDSPSAS